MKNTVIWSFFTILLLGIIPCRADDVPLRTGDQVTIRLSGVPADDANQVSAIYTVDGGGNVNLPYIGKIHASGLKQADLQSSIETAYKTAGIYTAPVITVSVQFDRYVDVQGDVRAPQRVRYTPDMTLLSAIAACQSFTDYADETKVSILRNGSRIIVNVKKVLANKETDPAIEPGDKVSVPRSIW